MGEAPKTVACKACGKPVPLAGRRKDSVVVYCEACGAGFFILETLPPEDAAEARQEFRRITLPEGWRVFVKDGVLRHDGAMKDGGVMGCLGVLALFMGAVTALALRDGSFLAWVFGLGTLAIVYGCAVVVFNRIELRAGKGRLRLYNGPIPPVTDIDGPSSEAGAVCWRVRIPSSGSGTFARGSVFLMHQGRETTLIGDMAYSQIEKAAAMIEGHLR